MTAVPERILATISDPDTRGSAGAFARTVAAAAAGRLLVYLLFREHWSWQPPYHLAYLQPPDFYDPVSHEYLVAHMPGYWAFLRLLRGTGLELYAAAPAVQTILQLLAIGRLTTTLGRVATPARPGAALLLAVALGFDPWLCETAIVMQPASLTASLFIILVERSAASMLRTMGARALPALTSIVLTSAGVCAVGTYLRADVATDVVLLPASIALTAWLIGAATPARAAWFAAAASSAALAIVLALLLPRAIWLRGKSGSLVMTTNSGGGALWYGLGEIGNPWNIPNPETGDAAIEAFGRARGYPSAFASARASAFFADRFKAHVRDQPAFLVKVIAARLHRATLGWAPAAMSFQGDYQFRPQIHAMSARMDAGASRLRLLFTRDYAGWILKIFGLRYLGTGLLWTIGASAAWFLARRPDAHPLLLLPPLAYAVGVAVFVLVHWSYRYGQQYYWLGWLSLYLITTASARARRR